MHIIYNTKNNYVMMFAPKKSNFMILASLLPGGCSHMSGITWGLPFVGHAIHGALARPADGPEGYMRLHPFLMGLAFSLMISLGFWMFLGFPWYI